MSDRDTEFRDFVTAQMEPLRGLPLSEMIKVLGSAILKDPTDAGTWLDATDAVG